MTEQEKFEAWWNKESGWRKAYDADDWFDITFEAWQASRAAALEEAAKECDRMQAMFERQSLMNEADAAEQCAMGIRALK